jgi:hypothetical protein
MSPFTSIKSSFARLIVTEEEYQSLKPFKDLPFCEEGDPMCDFIDKVDANDTGFTGEVFEADDVTVAFDYMHRADLVPTGGIRHHGDVSSIVFAYFRKKR